MKRLFRYCWPLLVISLGLFLLLPGVADMRGWDKIAKLDVWTHTFTAWGFIRLKTPACYRYLPLADMLGFELAIAGMFGYLYKFMAYCNKHGKPNTPSVGSYDLFF